MLVKIMKNIDIYAKLIKKIVTISSLWSLKRPHSCGIGLMKNHAEGANFLEHNTGFQQFTIYPLKKAYETMNPPIRGGVESMTLPIRGGLDSTTPPLIYSPTGDNY